MRWLLAGACAFALALSLAPAARAEDKLTEEKLEKLKTDVKETMDVFKKEDPGIKDWFEKAHAYAVFPEVAKGAIGIGGAGGKGLVYQKDKLIGWVELSQLTVGLQLGGQAYREVIFLENESALSNFKSKEAKLSAQASAVAVTAGASADAEYDEGVAIFTMPRGGLMFEASVGGQTFKFHEIKEKEAEKPKEGGGASE
jgi:lipid-binding SYLF domain-containing protein